MQTYSAGDVTLNLFVRPQAFDDFNPDTWERLGAGDTVAARFKKQLTEQGLPYYLLDQAVSWSGRDEQGWKGGTIFSRSLHLDEDDLCLSLTGETSRENVSLDCVSLETLRRLAAPQTRDSVANGLARPVDSVSQTDFRRVNEYWQTEFQNGHVNLGIMIVPPPFDTEAAARWDEMEGVLKQGNGTETYYVSAPKTGPEAPMSVSIACLGASGFITVHAGVPYVQRDNVAADALDFLTIEDVREWIARIESYNPTETVPQQPRITPITPTTHKIKSY